jgi:hypothetical protein
MADTEKVSQKHVLSALILAAIGGLACLAGFAWSNHAHAASDSRGQGAKDTEVSAQPKKRNPKIVYPTRTELDFEGAQIEGELRNPGEFYFQHRHEEKFDSLVKPRTQFHREMLRDAMLSK